MICFLSGGAKNGKSSLAQDIAVKLANGGKRYYVATMIPVDSEDHDRIRRHILDRDGMGFETLECGRNILSCLSKVSPESTFLLDSVTALLMNELFPVEKNYEMDIQAADRCAAELMDFISRVKNAVVVSDYIYSDAQRYDSITETYRKALAAIDRKMAQISDVVIEMSAGQILLHKGELPL